MGKIGFRGRINYPRPERELVEGFKGKAVANIGDAMGRFYIMDPEIHTINNPDIQMTGTAVTVRVRPGDNLMIHQAVEMASPGDVLVIDAGGSKCGVWGELLSLWAVHKGLAGIVIDGAVRDRAIIREMDFPVFTRHVSPAGGDKDGPGEINFPISCGNTQVNPGDIVVGDADGVVVIPREDAGEVLAGVKKVMEKEAVIAENIKNGFWDRPWLEATLREKGFSIED